MEKMRKNTKRSRSVPRLPEDQAEPERGVLGLGLVDDSLLAYSWHVGHMTLMTSHSDLAKENGGC